MSPTDRDLDHDAKYLRGSPSVELSSHRTSLSLERTKMAADRTLMGIVRTSLSLIGFGFTISEAFRELQRIGALPHASGAPLALGLALVSLGVLMLAMGIVSHMRFSNALNARRSGIFQKGLLRHDLQYRATPTFVIAFLLLLIGISALVVLGLRLLHSPPV